MIPQGGEALVNHNGTAPGIWLEQCEKILVQLPGPPRECLPIFRESVLPRLRQRTGQVRVTRSVRIFGLPEAVVESRLHDCMTASQNPAIAPYVKDGEVEIRLRAWADTEEAAYALTEAPAREIAAEFGDHAYSLDGETLSEVLVRTLQENGLHATAAESCTGGLVTAAITSVAGASEVFDGGVCSYANSVKAGLLGVSETTLREHGAVSEACAAEMARGVRRLDWRRPCRIGHRHCRAGRRHPRKAGGHRLLWHLHAGGGIHPHPAVPFRGQRGPGIEPHPFHPGGPVPAAARRPEAGQKAMSGLTLRPARIGDSAFLARLCREALGYDASPDAVAETLGRLSRQQDHTSLLAEWNGCPAGFIHTQRYEVLYAPAMMNVLGLAVSPRIPPPRHRARPAPGCGTGCPSPGGSPPSALPPAPSGTQAHQFYQSCGCLPHKQQLKFHKSLVPAGDSAGPSALRREV